MSQIPIDCVIALSFGRHSPLSIKDPNSVITDAAAAYKVPIITQQDIAQLLPIDVSVSVIKKIGYTDTSSVLIHAKNVVKQRGYKNIVIICHKAHVKRVAAQANKVGISPIQIIDATDIWDSHSKQWWTRRPLLWSIHEFFTVPYLKLTNRM